MKRTKTLAFALAGTLALCPLAACGNDSGTGQPAEDAPAQDAATEEDAPAQAEDAGADPMVGGWEAFAQTAPILTDEQAELFGRAAAEYVGVDLEPVAVLATQLVSGNNYAYLCHSTTVTAEPVSSWAVAVVYEDLEGNASITSVNDIDIAEPAVADTSTGEAGNVGGWEVVVPETWAPLPEQAATAITGALSDYVGVGLTPVALLGTQLVSGTNYRALCAGAPVVAEPTNNLYMLTVYADLEGNAEVTSVETLDLLAYVG